MKVSVVIPTRNRKESLFRLLSSLSQSSYPIFEVIIVDSSDNKLSAKEFQNFESLKITCMHSVPSVCIQRNIGIMQASGEWILLCDDDLEVPTEYLQFLTDHLQYNPHAGAVSGIVMQKEDSAWKGEYPVISLPSLLWRFIFQLSIWGEIRVAGDGVLTKWLKAYYEKRGNHLSKAGWPVITDFSGDFFKTPLYGLGASLVRKKWLINSPYDEILDAHGVGDNYGVAAGFPEPGIHVVKKAKVYHHEERTNRLENPLQYFRRVLALDYFFSVKNEIKKLSHRWFLWSLFGNWMGFTITRNGRMAKAARKALWIVLTGGNPYIRGTKNHRKAIEPVY